MTKKYRCCKDAEEWMLFTDMEGVEQVAKLLNEKLENLINESFATDVYQARTIRDKMFKFMDQYADWGASDSEPEYVLVEELRKVFNLTEDELVCW